MAADEHDEEVPSRPVGRLEPVATLHGHTGTIWTVCWSRSGVLASAGSDCSIRVYNGNSSSYQLITTLTTFPRTIRELAFSADGRSLAVASFDATATILELHGGPKPYLEAVVGLEGHESELKGVQYSSSGGLLATCSRDRSVWIWEVGLEWDYDCIGVLNGHSGDVKCVKWHPEIELLVSGSYDNTIRVWVEDDDDWFCSETLTAHSGTVWDMSFCGGEKLVSVGGDGCLIVWKRRIDPSGCRFQTVARLSDLHEGECIYSVDWKERIATGGGDDCIRIVSRIDNDKDEYAETASIERAHAGDVNCIRWNPTQTDILASAGDDACVRIWKYVE